MEFLIIACLILLNGVFAMSEIAFISVRKSKLASEAERGNKLAASALKLAGKPDLFLSTVQVGITLIGIITGLYSGDVLAEGFAKTMEGWGLAWTYAYPLAQVVIVISVTYLTIVFGELVPKRLGMVAAERIAKIMVHPMRFVSKAAAPFVWALSKSTGLIFKAFGITRKAGKITEEEIKSMVKEGARDGEVQAMEQHIVERAFNLGDRDLESIMTHRSDIVRIDVNMTAREIVRLVHKHPFNKYPVIDRSMDKTLGVVHVRDMLGVIHDPDFDIRKYIRPVEYFPETMGVYAALDEIKAKHLQYGLVCDEFGSVKGIVSLKDILEALVGTILDPNEEAEIIQREDGSFLVDGQCSFYNFLIHFNREGLYGEHDYNTISGLLLELLAHIPAAGEKLEWNGFTFEIMDMDGARIDKVLVTQHIPEPDGEDDED